jgi:sugar phosphate isomerase/epimerase
MKAVIDRKDEHMKFGLPTLIELPSIEAHAALAKALGLDFVELNMSFQLCALAELRDANLMALAEKYGIAFTIHLDEEMNIAHFNPLVRGAYFETVKETIRLAKESGIHILNMHLNHGVWVTLPENKVYLNEVYQQEYHEALHAFQAMCEEETRDADIHISLENTNGYLPHEWEAVDLLLKSPCFALTLDTGHAFTHPSDLAGTLLRKDRLAHMHLHDATPASDHLSLGTGEIRVQEHLTLAEESGASVLIEVKTSAALAESVVYLKGYDKI